MHDQARLPTVKAASLFPDEHFIVFTMACYISKHFGRR
jgi:hypothetical protein